MDNRDLPAYPLFCGPGDMNNAVGLTKREAFAMAAMPLALQFFEEGYCGNAEGTTAQVAECAVQVADALLAALESGERGR